jgi:hypothetical protein
MWFHVKGGVGNVGTDLAAALTVTRVSARMPRGRAHGVPDRAGSSDRCPQAHRGARRAEAIRLAGETEPRRDPDGRSYDRRPRPRAMPSPRPSNGLICLIFLSYAREWRRRSRTGKSRRCKATSVKGSTSRAPCRPTWSTILPLRTKWRGPCPSEIARATTSPQA